MKTPEAGEIWEWHDQWGWNATFILTKPVNGLKKMWEALCIESNEPGEKGQMMKMSFSNNTIHGWRYIA